jgi:hypothetical protein
MQAKKFAWRRQNGSQQKKRLREERSLRKRVGGGRAS